MTLPDTLRYLSLSALDPRSDGELVAEFVGTREESAFAELLRRHGPMVFGVCRRILGHGPDADDAFQAVFLVLARKANTIRPPGMVGNWLYGVAVRTANKARVMNARRMKREQRSATSTAANAGERDPETLALIDAELAALPAVYRAAFVACDLNGRSRSEAARELGWPEGTVAARLAKARELLAARLRKRGVTLGAATFAAVAVPTAVSADTLLAVRELLAVGTASAVIPAAQQLSEEVVKTMGTFKLKLVAMVCLVIAIAGGAAAFIAGPGEKHGPRAERQPVANAPIPKNLSSDPGLIWVVDAKTGDLIAYTPSGVQDRRLSLKDVHPATDVLLGIALDGRKLAFARPLKQGAGLTLYLRDLDSDEMIDTGIRMDFAADWADVLRVPQYGWVASGRYALLSDRKQEKPFAPLKYNLVDLENLTQTPVELPWDHIPTDVSRDGKKVLSIGVGPHGGRMAFYLSETSGGQPILLPSQENISADSSPHVARLAPDGQSILFKGSHRSGEKEAWRRDTYVFGIDDGSLSAVEREESERDTRIDDWNLSWSPDGRRVAAGWMLSGYTKSRGGIRVCDPDGGNPSQAAAFRSTVTPGRLLGWYPTPKRNAPVPKEKTDAGLIWLHDNAKDCLLAYAPDGTNAFVVKLPDRRHFGVSRDGAWVLIPGKDGKDAVGQNDGLTLHRWSIVDSSRREDLGIECLSSDTFIFSPDGKSVVRCRMKKAGGLNAPVTYTHTLHDLATKAEKPLDLAEDLILTHWSADGKTWQFRRTLPFGRDEKPVRRWLTMPAGGGKATPICTVDDDGLDNLEPSPHERTYVATGYSLPKPEQRKFSTFRVTAATGRIEELKAYKEVNAVAARWSLDGKRLAVLKHDAPDGSIQRNTSLFITGIDGSDEVKLLTLKDDGQQTSLLGWYPTPRKNSPVPKADVEWKEGKPILFDTHPHGDRVTGVAYSPDGKFIAVAVGEQVRLLDAVTRKQVNEHALTAKVPATITAVAFSPKGDKLAMTAKDYVIIYSELGKSPSSATDRSWAMKGFDPNQVAWLSDDRLVASNGEEVVWRIRDEKADIRWKLVGGNWGQPSVLAAIPGQSAVFLTHSEHKKEANDVYMAAEPPSSSPQIRLTGHKYRPMSAVVSKDGKRILSVDEGGTLIVWEPKDGPHDFVEKSRVEMARGVVQLALAPDGRTVAVLRVLGVKWTGGAANRSSEVFELFVFDITNPPAKPAPIWANDTRSLPGKRSGPASLAFSPDGKTLLAAFADPYTEDKLYGPIPKSMGVKVWELAPKQ